MGQIEKKIKNKKYLMYYSNGDKYEGLWKDNQKNVYGTMIYNNGDRYEGFWKDNKKDGLGTMIYNNGDKYEGFWEDDSFYMHTITDKNKNITYKKPISYKGLEGDVMMNNQGATNNIENINYELSQGI